MAAYDLKIALQKVGPKRVPFGLYKGGTSKQIVVGIKLDSAQVAGLEKEHGRLQVALKGVCFRENGELVFAAKTDPAPLGVLFNKAFKDNHCAAFLPVSLRKLGETESDAPSEAEKDEPAGATSAGADTAAAPDPGLADGAEAVWKKLKAVVAPRVAPAIAAHPAQGPELLRLVKEALGKEKEGRWTEATSDLQKVGKMLAELGGVKTEPGTAKAETDAAKPPAGPSEAALTATMQKIAPLLKAALAANPGRREELARPYTDFQAQMKAGQFSQAQASITRLAGLLRPQPAAPATPAPSAAAAAAAAEIPKGTVDYAKCRLLWDSTKKAVHAELQTLEKMILETFAEAPAFAQLAQKIRKFDTVLAGFEEDLGDFLDGAANSEKPEDRQKFHKQAADTVREFQRRALSNPFLDRLEANPFLPVKAKQTLTKSLDSLVARLV